MFKLKKFYQSEEEFQEIRLHLKLTHCAHCRLIGFLILHGCLYGYDEQVCSVRIVRAHRFFCSNRALRGGCGKTFSVFDVNVLGRFTITSHSFGSFLENLAQGMNKMQAFKKLNLNFSNSTVYRLYKTFQTNQSRIRTLLLKLCPIPPLKHYDPVLQTICHLKSVFKQLSPVAAFQEHFQVSFL